MTTLWVQNESAKFHDFISFNVSIVACPLHRARKQKCHLTSFHSVIGSSRHARNSKLMLFLPAYVNCWALKPVRASWTGNSNCERICSNRSVGHFPSDNNKVVDCGKIHIDGTPERVCASEAKA